MTTMEEGPLVSILTPVYNGDKHLAECIESIIAQTHKNWEYVIVNNCSTDRTLEIASGYACKDARIRVVCNRDFRNCEENHNIAFSLISEKSRYCKVVSADDTITPVCVEKMVKLAESNPSIGIVGSYQLRGSEVKWKGLPIHVTVLKGREACRLSILENAQIFGSPTSELYNSEMVRKNQPFYPNLLPYSDTSACYKYLNEWDFGFVHDVLSIERIHENQISWKARGISMDNIGCLDSFLTYGKNYLSQEEYEKERIAKIEAYHRWLGGCLLKLKGSEFWNYQIRALKRLGCPIRWTKIIKGSIDEIKEEIRRPKQALLKVFMVFRKKL